MSLFKPLQPIMTKGCGINFPLVILKFYSRKDAKTQMATGYIKSFILDGIFCVSASLRESFSGSGAGICLNKSD
jgi:hypothetical protein